MPFGLSPRILVLKRLNELRLISLTMLENSQLPLTVEAAVQSVHHGKLLSLFWRKSSSDGYEVVIWSLLSRKTEHDLMRTENRTHSSKGSEEPASHNESESGLENIVWTGGSLHSPLVVLTTKMKLHILDWVRVTSSGFRLEECQEAEVIFNVSDFPLSNCRLLFDNVWIRGEFTSLWTNSFA